MIKVTCSFCGNEIKTELPIKHSCEIIVAKYGITTKWNGMTTYHETTEQIRKAQEK